MDKSYLKRKPTKYLCPICGDWHPWNGGTLESLYKKHLERCINTPEGQNTGLYYITYKPEKEEFEFEVLGRCGATSETGSYDNIPISYFERENSSQDCVICDMSFFADEDIGPEYCSKRCKARIEGICYFFNNYKEATNGEFSIPIGFEFGEDAVYESVEETTTDVQTLKDTENKPKNTMEAISMENKVSTVWKQLYEHSPKENVEIVGNFLNKYKPALKWAVPVVSIYAAYRILNSKDSDLTVDNVGDVCKSKLGFDMDSLKDKKALNKLLHLGRPIVLAYGAIKLSSAIFSNKDPKELSPDDVEEGLEKLDDAKNKYGWIQPMTEKILPVALSVITVYLMTRKPVWFEKAEEKVMETVGNVGDSLSTYGELAKLFIADKFNIDLDDEEQKKKAICFTCLALIVVIGVLLYGKKVLDKKKVEDDDSEPENKALKVFMGQVLVILKKLAPSAFSVLATWAITKNLLDDDIIDAEFWEAEEGEESEGGSLEKEGGSTEEGENPDKDETVEATEGSKEPDKEPSVGDGAQKPKKATPKRQGGRKKPTKKVETEDNQEEHTEP